MGERGMGTPGWKGGPAKCRARLQHLGERRRAEREVLAALGTPSPSRASAEGVDSCSLEGWAAHAAHCTDQNTEASEEEDLLKVTTRVS